MRIFSPRQARRHKRRAEARRDSARGSLPFFPAYRGRELDFIFEVLGRTNFDGDRLGYHPAQRAMVRSHFERKRTHVRGGRKQSKSFTLADCALAALYTRPCVVLLISSSWTNVKRQLLANVAEAHGTSRTALPGRVLDRSIEISPKHYLMGLSTEKSENVQGWHPGVIVPRDPDANVSDEEMLELLERAKADGKGQELHVFLDECPGIRDRIYQSLRGSMQGPLVHVWQSGNPTLDQNADHFFALDGQPGSAYHRIKLTHYPESLYPDPVPADEVFTAPNWVADPKWAEEELATFGADSAYFKAMVLGQYASGDEATKVIPASLLVAASEREVDVDFGPHIGCDLSGGGDECVLALWLDGVKCAVDAWRPNREDPTSHMQTAQRIITTAEKWGRQIGQPIPGDRIHVDKGGLGDPICARMAQLGCHVDRVDFGGSPRGSWRHLTGDTEFENQRAEMHWAFRRVLEEGMASLPREYRESWKEAQWPEYELAYSGSRTALKITPKKQIIAQYGRSPDHLDADLLAWCRKPKASISVGWL